MGRKITAFTAAMAVLISCFCGCSGGASSDGNAAKNRIEITKASFEEKFRITTTAEDTKIIADVDTYYLTPESIILSGFV